MAGTLKRRETMARILAARGNALVVTGLGSTTYDAFATHDSPLTFYLWGAMGAAAMIGLGLANAQPQRRVLVVTGDGEMLMGLGSLATIGAQRTANLSIVVIDNEHYAETGMQPSHTARGVDLAGIANAAGFAHASTIRTQPELESTGAGALHAAGSGVRGDQGPGRTGRHRAAATRRRVPAQPLPCGAAGRGTRGRVGLTAYLSPQRRETQRSAERT